MSCGLEPHDRASGLIPVRSAILPYGEPVPRGRQGSAWLLLVGLSAAWILTPRAAVGGQGSNNQELATQEVPSPFKVQVQRNMVLVRAIVRDAKGLPVSGLKKEDFRLFDNGKPQDIDQFAVESSNGNPAVPAKVPEEEPTGEERSARPPEDTIPRNYQALYFDDVQMQFEDIAHARDAADRYLAATLTPAGRVGIFTSSGQDVLDFTDDRSQIHATLFKLRPRPNYLRELNACPDISQYQAYLIVEQRDPDATAIAADEYVQCNCSGLPAQAQQSCINQAPNAIDGDATRIMVTGETQSNDILRGLEQVVRRTALLPGRRSVIFLSPGFLFYNLEAQIGEIADRALRSNVVVNALDPRGLYVIIPGGDASRSTAVIPSNAGLSGRKSQLIMNGYSIAEEVLAGLSSDTGGQFFHNSNDLDKGFRQVGTLAEVSYVLAFSPRNLKPDGRFHKLKVSLANPKGYTLQARRGYFAPKASEDAAARAKEEIQDAVYSQDDLRELPIEVHTQFFKLNESDVRLSVLTHLDMSSLHFLKQQDRNSDDLTFITVLFDRDGKYLTGKEKKVICHLRDDTLARLSRTGITLKMEFDVKPGTYMVRQIVRDSQAGQLSGLSRTVEIPY
ncbi:MAG: VWA domain-containing protein [Terriglobia bacterium]